MRDNGENDMVNMSLSEDEIQILKSQGKVNEYKLRANKSIKEIIFSNIFTLFNTINIVLALFVLLTGSFKNLLFMIIIVINTLIGIYQEIKAKKILDNLTLIATTKVKVYRNSKEVLIMPNEVVLGEYIKVTNGDQIVCDSELVDGSLECDESLLTGESDMIVKQKGDKLFSGSFVTSGSGIVKAINVGEDNYINKLASQAKVYKVYPSKLRDSLNYILKMASFMIVPIGIGLFIKMHYIQNIELNESILKIVAALIGMIAEGLILLTSVSLAVSSVNLARKRILVQELFCIETLARVDTLCFDKTGTITTGNMKVVDIVGEDKYKDIIGDYVRVFDDLNNTSKAIIEYTEAKRKLKTVAVLPFSSAKKYSAVTVENEGTYVLGAFEYIFKDKKIEDNEVIASAVKDGKRVLVFAHSNDDICNGDIRGDINLLAVIILEDEIRNNIKEIFDYFKGQDVDIKIISGDNHISVLEIAKRAGLQKNGKAIDVSKLTDEELKKAVLEYQVFGRVNPAQKKLMVKVLKENGHIVAMSGDGVNDVLALKEADISIAMANGSAATKQIANIVLLDSEFSNFYSILMEGRRVINNIQKVASLFLVKTFYSAGISILSIFTPMVYPFIPIHLTMISTLTVGIPSFVITFEKSKERIKDNFMKEVLTKSSTAAVRLILAIVIVQLMNFQVVDTVNMIFIMTLINGLLMLQEVLRPFNKYKGILYSAIILMGIIPFIFFRDFFVLDRIPMRHYFISILIITVVYFGYKYILRYGKEFLLKKRR